MSEGPIKTWEQAARERANSILTINLQESTDPMLAISSYINAIHESADADYQASCFLPLAHTALAVYAGLSGVDVEAALNNVLTTLSAKQADYGPQNILWAGVPGIALRMHDKYARIQNLVMRGTAGENEPLADSWLDLVGYSICGLMLLNGEFEYPLERDVPEIVTYTEAPGVTVTVSGIEDQLLADPSFADAFRQFNAAATTPDNVEQNPFIPNEYNIHGGGKIQIQHDGPCSTVILTNAEGQKIAVATDPDEDGVSIATQDDGIICNTDILTVLLCLQLGAAEAALGWRNTNVQAEVPNNG